MIARSPAHASLQLMVQKAERRAAVVLHQLETSRPSTHQAHLQDHRTAVAGDLADEMDLIEPGLGTRLMQAMYPEINLAAVTL